MERLTQEAREKIAEKLDERVGDFAFCAICGRREWAFQDGIFSVRRHSQEVDDPEEEDQFMLLIGVSCKNCGNTHFLDIAILELMGIVADSWEQVTVGSD